MQNKITFKKKILTNGYATYYIYLNGKSLPGTTIISRVDNTVNWIKHNGWYFYRHRLTDSTEVICTHGHKSHNEESKLPESDRLYNNVYNCGILSFKNLAEAKQFLIKYLNQNYI